MAGSMTATRLTAVLSATLAAATWFSAETAQAQSFPSKPIRAIVGYAAGGSVDTAMRGVGNDMSARLGQAIVIDNKPGATGMIALDLLKDVPADGYTIEAFATPTVVASILAGKAVADPAAAFTPIGYMWQGGIVVETNPAAPYMANVHTLNDLIAAVKANPGKVYYTSAGTGSSGHLVGALLGVNNGMDWSHVGYKGLAPATANLLAGRVNVIMGSVQNDLQFVKEDKLRLIVSTAPQRESKYPDVPTVVEAGYPDLVLTSWGGVIAPGGVPKPVANRLAAELKTSMARQEVQKIVVTMSVPYGGGAEEYQKRYVTDYQNFARAIKAANIKVE